jgi:hypothetical protein
MAQNINDNEKSSRSQCAMILDWLERGFSLTQMQALERFQCFRLASRVNDLRNRGYSIEMHKIRTNSGKMVGEYKLVK